MVQFEHFGSNVADVVLVGFDIEVVAGMPIVYTVVVVHFEVAEFVVGIHVVECQ